MLIVTPQMQVWTSVELMEQVLSFSDLWSLAAVMAVNHSILSATRYYMEA
jgi:hypothetical protein